MQTLVNHLGAQAQGQQRRGHPAFLATNPPIFKGTKEPLDADFWLNTIEDKFGLFPCNDDEKVTFAAHQLRDAAGAWWKNYKAQVVENHVITWAEFREAFRAHHIPEGVLELKREEFLSLTQGNKSVREYAHAFNYLSQYAKEDVSTDAKKRYRFMKGLSLKLKNHLSATDFNDYNHMVSKAIKSEASMNELEVDNNRKRVAPSSSSYGGGSQRARTGPPPPPRVPGYGAPQPMWMARRPPLLKLKLKLHVLRDSREAVVDLAPVVHAIIVVHKVTSAGSVPPPRKVEPVMFQISPKPTKPTAKATRTIKYLNVAS
ncbi:unnamed protein product [Urochloa humidicola]